MKAFYPLKSFIRENKWKYLAGLIFLAIVDLLQLVLPQVLKSTTDLLQSGNINKKTLFIKVLTIIIIGIGVSIGRFLWRTLIIGTSRSLEYTMRKNYFSHLLSLDANFFNNNKTGDLMAYATNDIQTVRFALGQGIMMAFDSTFMAIFAIAIMIYTSGLKMTLISLVALPFLGFIVFAFQKSIHQRSRDVQNSFSSMSEVTQEYFSGIRVLQSFVAEDKAKAEFKKANKNNQKKHIALIKVSGVLQPIVMLISGFSFVVLNVYGGISVINGEITLGTLIALHNYIRLLVWPMMAMGYIVNILQRGIASMERINKIMNIESTIFESDEPIYLKDGKGIIRFENVSFSYPEQNHQVLKNISFEIKKGQTLGVIGPTGSGKSTIAQLILKFFNINSGKITYDGIDIKEIETKSLRENMAYVPQDNFLFSETIAENIGFSSDGEIPFTNIKKAAHFASVDKTIESFPNKYKTVMGERGVNLSGGQKQRISLARAIAKEAPFLILDDSLSAVDAKTQEDILAHIKELKQSLLLISHRVMTLKHADHIIALKNGKILEEGNHNELMAKNGYYANLYKQQELEAKVE